MTQIEKATAEFHSKALELAKEYANTHGNSIIEEVAYGRGVKKGFIIGYEQAKNEAIKRACDWIRAEVFQFRGNLYKDFDLAIEDFRKSMEK